PAGRHPVRQAPCPEAPGRGDGPGPQAGVCPPVGPGPAVPQGAALHPAGAWGQPHGRGAGRAETAVRGQQAAAHGLPAQGVLRATVGLPQPAGAWRFYCQWRNALRWQRLEPFARFARMIAGPWDGIAASCHNENKVPLGFVEGLNNKIRVLQRRAYGLRDEEYLRLMILTCMLPKL